MILIIIGVCLGIFYMITKKPAPRPPGILQDCSPSWMDPETERRMEEQQKLADYWRNHYFSLDLNCFIKKRPSGTYVRSVPFEDWIDGAPDDTGDIVHPTDILDRETWNLWKQCSSIPEFYHKMRLYYPDYFVSDDDDDFYDDEEEEETEADDDEYDW